MNLAHPHQLVSVPVSVLMAVESVARHSLYFFVASCMLALRMYALAVTLYEAHRAIG